MSNVEMIGLVLKGHKIDFELKMLLKAFYPEKDIKLIDSEEIYGYHVSIVVAKQNNDVLIDIIETNKKVYGKRFNNIIDVEDKKIIKRKFKYSLFTTLKEYSNINLPWGILTGIRPTKIVLELISEGKNRDDIKNILMNDYCISEEKINLMLDVAQIENQVLSKNKNNEVSVYIGIPFCPSRCIYCSFTSYSVEKYKSVINDYLIALKEEMKAISQVIKDKKIKTIYIGGGTPTSLNEEQLKILLENISQIFDTNGVEEYTIEAGRPDTISIDKLKILKQYKISRLSINPQTMNQKTLDTIGRKHTVEDIIQKFELARSLGFDNINMDLILGLPDEGIDEVNYTMNYMKKLNPDSITVHTLALKRTSRLKTEKKEYNKISGEILDKMLSIAYNGIIEMGMKPYYMYRQKNILGNYENVGYALPKKECIYNIEIIEEKQSIIAFGAGAVTKLINYNQKTFDRVENVKNVEQYIDRVEEMIGRKKKKICGNS